MKLTLPPNVRPTARRKERTKSRLPGEPRPFKESIRNLTPPQHLDPRGNITSAREKEVTRGEDPLILRIRELEAEVRRLKEQLRRPK